MIKDFFGIFAELGWLVLDAWRRLIERVRTK